MFSKFDQGMMMHIVGGVAHHLHSYSFSPSTDYLDQHFSGRPRIKSPLSIDVPKNSEGC